MNTLSSNIKFKNFNTIAIYMRNPGYFRNIEWVIESLLQLKNIDITIFVGGLDTKKSFRESKRFKARLDLQKRYPNINFVDYPKSIPANHRLKTHKLILDMCFFLQNSTYSNKPARIRIERNLNYSQLFILKLVYNKHQTDFSNYIYDRYLRSLSKNKLTPEFEEIIKFNQFDQVCFIPSVGDEKQILIASMCSVSKIPTIALIASWDNLTIKGQFIDVFSKTICWSEAQLNEIKSLHHLSNDQNQHIAVGAYPFAHRTNIVKNSSKISTKTIHLTWFMSSGFISNFDNRENKVSDELKLIEEFASYLAKNPHLQNKLKVKIKLHPQSFEDDSVNLFLEEIMGNTKISFEIESFGEPIGQTNRDLYTQLLLNTDVCVGLVTTALFEAALLRKPCVIPPGELATRSFRVLQHGKYLTTEFGGPADLSSDWPDFFDKVFKSTEFKPNGEFESWLIPELTLKTPSEVAHEIVNTFNIKKIGSTQMKFNLGYSTAFTFLLVMQYLNSFTNILSRIYKKFIKLFRKKNILIKNKLYKSLKIFRRIVRKLNRIGFEFYRKLRILINLLIH